mmetsp:Transcript_35373/g.49108  ORF Transcript_35373/g.49108 Transcript_35373/m.49108 type:complete len:144 (-) Transcript_35373:47-478(-)
MFQGHIGGVLSLSVSGDGKLLASGSTDGVAFIWDLFVGTKITLMKDEKKGGKIVCFSPDGKFLVFGGDDGIIRTWHVKSLNECLLMQGHTASINALAFSPTRHQQLISASMDLTMRGWQFKARDKTDHPETIIHYHRNNNNIF